MTTLVFASSSSQLFAREAILEQNRTNGDIVVISATPNVNAHLKNAGLPSQLITTSISESWGERDAAFANLAMPGVFEEATFPGTNLPLWKVLSIDRLYFWYGGRNSAQLVDFVDSLVWDELLVDLNIHSPYPAAVMHLADKRWAKIRAVKTMPIRTNEMFDVLPYLTIHKFITDKRSEAQFLKDANAADIIVREETGEEQKQTVDRSVVDLRNGLGIGEGEHVTGVVFDKRHEAICRAVLPSMQGRVIFFTLDNRSKELLPKCLHGYSVQTLPSNMMVICDEIVAFDWYEQLEEYQDRLVVVDPYGFNRMAGLVPEGIEVKEK